MLFLYVINNTSALPTHSRSYVRKEAVIRIRNCFVMLAHLFFSQVQISPFLNLNWKQLLLCSGDGGWDCGQNEFSPLKAPPSWFWQHGSLALSKPSNHFHRTETSYYLTQRDSSQLSFVDLNWEKQDDRLDKQHTMQCMPFMDCQTLI